jgi:ribosomal protein S18 acetylase RimI-like enzyme
MLFTDRTPRSFALFRRMARTTLKYIFPPEGWETEMVEDNDRAYAFNMVSCFYLDVVTAYGAPELTPVYCRMDELLYERLPPTIRWQRTRILGKGDDCCNFRWSLRDEARFWMHSPITRVATPADAATISSLLLEFNQEALSPEDLGQRMEQAQGLETVFLGELDGRMAGLLVLRTAPTLASAQDWAEITELYVQPASRRRGVGTALIDAALAHARHRGCTEVHLLVDPKNTPALSFYQAVGFHRDSWDMVQKLQGPG